MTVSTSNNSVVYRGNGSATAFAVPFKVLDEDHLIVKRRVYATGADDHTYTGTDYSYSGFGASSGTLTLAGTALSSTYELVIERDVPVTQDLDIVNAGGFYPESVEEQLDLMVMAIQQLAARVDRAILAPVGETMSSLPALDTLVGKFISFDADGRPISSSGSGADSALRSDLATSNGSSLVGYGPRSLLLKLREHPSLYDYGAVEGENCTDAYLTALEEEVPCLLIPEGEFGISEGIISTNTDLIGQGDSSIINVLETMDKAITYSKILGECRGFRINCNNLAETGLYGVTCQGTRISRIKIHQPNFDAAELCAGDANNSGTKFEACQFTSVGTTTVGTCSTSTNQVNGWTGTDFTTLGIRPYMDMVEVDGIGYTIASVTDGDQLTTTQNIGTKSAGTTCRILQGSGLLANINGNNSAIKAKNCFAHVCAAAGYKDMALYGLQTDGCYAEVCLYGRVIGVAGVVAPMGSVGLWDYQEGHDCTSYLIEAALWPVLKPAQLASTLKEELRIPNPTLVNSGHYEYMGVTLYGRRADVSNQTSYSLAFGEEAHVSTALGVGVTLNLPSVTAGSREEANLVALGGAAIPLFFGSLNGQTGTIKTTDGRTINLVAGTTGFAHTGNHARRLATFKPDGNWFVG